jgi:hypothetical protein
MHEYPLWLLAIYKWSYFTPTRTLPVLPLSDIELLSDAGPHYVCKLILSQHLSTDYAESVYTTLTGCSVVIAHRKAYEEANISKDSLYKPTHTKPKHLEFEFGLGADVTGVVFVQW